jgi:hypothetical protein
MWSVRRKERRKWLDEIEADLAYEEERDADGKTQEERDQEQKV